MVMVALEDLNTSTDLPLFVCEAAPMLVNSKHQLVRCLL